MNIKTLLYLILQGGAGSGNWGHVGDPPNRGGSSPTKNVTMSKGKEKTPVLSLKRGKDARRRQQVTKDSQFFKGNLKTSSIEQIWENSSEQVRSLAEITGIIATDKVSLEYAKHVLELKEKSVEHKSSFSDIGCPLTPSVTGIKDEIDSGSLSSISDLEEVESLLQGSLSDTNSHDLVISIVNSSLIKNSHYDCVERLKTRMQFIRPLTSEETTFLDKVQSLRTPTGKINVKGEVFIDGIKPGTKEFEILVGLERDQLAYTSSRDILQKVTRSIEIVRANSDTDDMADISDTFKDSPDIYSSTVDTIINKNKFKRNPDKPLKEDIADYVTSTLKKSGFNIPSDLPKYPLKKPEQMVALSTVTLHEKQDIEDIIRDTDDGYDPSTYIEVGDAFYIKSNGRNETNYKGALEKYGQDTEMKNMFHATSDLAGPFIATGGYRVSSGGMMDEGVYTTNVSSKASCYIKGDDIIEPPSPSSYYGKNHIRGIMLINNVAMGKLGSWEDTSYSERNSFDSFQGHPMSQEEWVTHDPKAVLPIYYVRTTLKQK